MIKCVGGYLFRLVEMDKVGQHVTSYKKMFRALSPLVMPLKRRTPFSMSTVVDDSAYQVI